MPEVLRLVRLVAASPDRLAVGLRWSWWRRRHQATARRCHRARRARLHPLPPSQPVVSIHLPGVPALTEPLITRLQGVLPPAAIRGRPATQPAQVLGGIVWVMRRGAPWREVPARFGPWRTVYGRYRLWRQDGTWDRVAAILTDADRHRPDTHDP